MEKQIEEIKRMTTNMPQSSVDTMFNYAYVKDGRVLLRYGDGEEDIDLCDYISREAAGFACKPSPEEVMEGACMVCDCPLAILYIVAVQAAELREKLKEFEDREENKGEWRKVYQNDKATVYECSNCHHLSFGTSDYCICGAKMKGGEG